MKYTLCTVQVTAEYAAQMKGTAGPAATSESLSHFATSHLDVQADVAHCAPYPK